MLTLWFMPHLIPNRPYHSSQAMLVAPFNLITIIRIYPHHVLSMTYVRSIPEGSHPLGRRVCAYAYACIYAKI